MVNAKACEFAEVMAIAWEMTTAMVFDLPLTTLARPLKMHLMPIATGTSLKMPMETVAASRTWNAEELATVVMACA